MAFQIHGHQGPKSYRYGFDTGKGWVKIHSTFDIVRMSVA
jgi:hypothetical protein